MWKINTRAGTEYPINNDGSEMAWLVNRDMERGSMCGKKYFHCV